MRNFADKIVWKVTTQISCSVSLLPKYCRLWQNAENCWRARQDTDDSTIRRMRFAYWITKATETHWEYVTLVAWPLQQWLHESASILRHSYAACLLLRAQLHANHIEHDVTFYTVLKPVHLPSAVRDITNSDNSLLLPCLLCSSLNSRASCIPVVLSQCGHTHNGGDEDGEEI